MARLAFRHLPTVEVSDWEIARGGKSYTAVTLQALAREGWRIVFLCGTDMFLTLEEWYSPKTIFELADIVCMPREEDGAMEKLEKKAQKKALKEAQTEEELAEAIAAIEAAQAAAEAETAAAEASIPVPHNKRGKISEKTLENGTIR